MIHAAPHPIADATKMTINPIDLFREAIEKYPRIKPLFGLLAAVALLIIVLSAKISPNYAIFGVLIILGLLVLLALAVGATRLPMHRIAVPIIVLIWAVLVLAIASMSFLFTGYFFNWPLAIRPGISTKQETRNDSEEGPPSLHSDSEDEPRSVLSVLSTKKSIPDGVIPEPGALTIKDDLLSGDGVHYVNTANLSGERKTINYIVLHRTEGSLRSTLTIVQREGERDISYHVVVAQDGTIVQFVPFNFSAHHVRDFNDQSVGVAAVGAEGIPIPTVQLNRLVAVLRLLRARYPDAKIVRHKDLMTTSDCTGNDFPFDKIKTLVSEKTIRRR